jgi:hypothetical protein
MQKFPCKNKLSDGSHGMLLKLASVESSSTLSPQKGSRVQIEQSGQSGKGGQHNQNVNDPTQNKVFLALAVVAVILCIPLILKEAARPKQTRDLKQV